MASFTNQKPRTATAEDIKAPWRGYKNGKHFRCWLCGHKFQIGDYWRWIAGGPKQLNNIIVCKKCDTGNDDCLEKFKELLDKCWWAVD